MFFFSLSLLCPPSPFFLFSFFELLTPLFIHIPLVSVAEGRDVGRGRRKM